MGRNLVQKIVGSHLVSGEMLPGSGIGLRVDQTLTQDALGTMAYLQFESMGIDRVKTLSVSYIDHNTLQDGFENADDHRYLQTVAARHGIICSKAGNGICHQVHVERFARPGQVLLGADSHTPTSGAVGMLAIGAGGLDVAVAMAGGPFHLAYPRVVRVELVGTLRPWCSAKDLALEALRILTTKGNVGTLVEYGGPALQGLGVPERATIANVGAEMGVTTSVFPSDGRTRDFLRAQGREADWIELLPDADASYDGVLTIDLARVEPLAACPHSPDNVKTVAALDGLEVRQVLVGSCTNSSYRDLMTVAGMLKGRKIHPDTSFGVAPGSRQVLGMLAANGALADLVAAGARILECACGFCVGCGQAPGSGTVSVRTNNRNYEGRSGTRDAAVYLASPETAAATALRGRLTDPRRLGIGQPAIPEPESFPVDDSLLLRPPAEGEGCTVVERGPNIGEPPRCAPMPPNLRVRVAIKVGDKVTTDHIMPAGPYLKYRSNIPRYSGFVFNGIDPGFAGRCRANAEAGLASAIVAGQSYGQGSSREHAAICPMYLGVRLLLAKGVERIHAANLVNFGILQLSFADEADYDSLEEGDELELSGVAEALSRDTATLRDLTRGRDLRVRVGLDERQRRILLAGGLLNHIAAGGA